MLNTRKDDARKRAFDADSKVRESFVGLVASAYLWALLGALLLLIDGFAILITGRELVAFDAIHHSFALGFLALLICGIAPRMLPSFSGGTIVSPKLVSATLWLGNSAAVLRVGSLLFASLLGSAIHLFLFGLSGPCGLALALWALGHIRCACRPDFAL